MKAAMKLKVLSFSIFFVLNLLPGTSLCQNKVVVIPLGTEAMGDANPSHVLKGKTFSNQNAAGLNGTRPPAPIPKMTAGDNKRGVPWPQPRFSGNLIYGYTDQLTGMQWSPPPTDTGRNWLDAVNYCEGLERGLPPVVISDWRMPSLRELHSLVDYSTENPALPEDHPFSSVLNHPYWSATVEVYGTTFPTHAWTVNMADGRVQAMEMDVDIFRFVWCVRGGINE